MMHALTASRSIPGSLNDPSDLQVKEDEARSFLEVSRSDEDDGSTLKRNQESSMNQLTLHSGDQQAVDVIRGNAPQGAGPTSSIFAGPMALMPCFRTYFVQERVCAFADHVLEYEQAKATEEVGPVSSSIETAVNMRQWVILQYPHRIVQTPRIVPTRRWQYQQLPCLPEVVRLRCNRRTTSPKDPVSGVKVREASGYRQSDPVADAAGVDPKRLNRVIDSGDRHRRRRQCYLCKRNSNYAFNIFGRRAREPAAQV